MMIQSFLMQVKTIGILLAALLILYKFFGPKFILGLVAIAVVLLTLVFFFQNKLLYMPIIPGVSLSPSQNPMGWKHPTEQGCPAENVRITTADSVELKGWLIKGENSERLIVYFHQNAGNLGLRIRYLKSIHKYTNSDVLIVAYRGFSDSQGTPTQQGLQKDSEAILDWAIRYKNEKLARQDKNFMIYILGRSLGGAVTLYISTKEAYSRQISGLILQNTFTNITAMVQALFPFLSPFSFIQTNFWPSITRIVLVKQPILFIRSLRDEIVPTSQMAELIQNALNAEFKQTYYIPNGTHNESWELDPVGYFKEFSKFFQRKQKTSKGQ